MSAQRTFNVAISDSVRGPMRPISANWSILAAQLSRVRVGSKEGAGWVAADIPAGPRLASNVLATSLLVFDIDNKEKIVCLGDLELAIEQQSLRALIHSTHSHTAVHPRYRVVIDITKSINPRDHKSLLKYVAQLLGLDMDPACSDLARYFYLPRCSESAIENYEYLSINGDALDVGASLKAMNKVDRNLGLITDRTVNVLAGWEESDANIEKVKNLLNECDPDCSYEIWRDLVWSVCWLQWDVGESLLIQWSSRAKQWVELGEPQKKLARLVSDYDPSSTISIGTLIHRAQVDSGKELPSLFSAKAVNSVINKNAPRFTILGREELRQLPPMEWIIDDVLPSKGLAAIYGPPGAGKTFLALDLAISISEGCKTWFEHRVKRRDVCYLALEGGAGIGKRIEAWELENNKGADSIKTVLNPFDIKNAEDVTQLLGCIGPALASGSVIFIDTLNQASPGSDENSSVDMGLAIAAAKRIAVEVNGLVVFIHHSGKSSDKGLRGHSSLNAAMDLTIEVTKMDRLFKWKTTKVKDGDDGLVKHFDLAIHNVSQTNLTKQETSCAVRTLHNPIVPKRVLTGKNQVTVYDCLSAVLENTQSIGLDTAVSLAKKELKAFGAERRAKDVIESLVVKKFFVMEGGLISLPNMPPPTPL